jgi:predicted NBD/HSP70 family sugar kinase
MYLVFDIGGTTLRGALYDPDRGRLLRTHRSVTPSTWSERTATAADLHDQLVRRIAEASNALSGAQPPAAVCLAFPGPVDATGRVLVTPTVSGNARSEPFTPAVELAHLWPSSTIHVINDVTAAGYRYVATGLADFCIVTVSSGVGHKVFVGGREIVGPGGRGGEIGHWVVDPSPVAPLCDCGGRGHVGAVASGRGALLLARRRAHAQPRLFGESALCRYRATDPEQLQTEDLVASFADEDAWTVRLIGDVAAPLGRALGAIHLTVGVERFVVVGGFALALGERYRALLASAARESCLDLGQDWDAMIQLGYQDDDSGLIGAGIYLQREFGDRSSAPRIPAGVLR